MHPFMLKLQSYFMYIRNNILHCKKANVRVNYSHPQALSREQTCTAYDTHDDRISGQQRPGWSTVQQLGLCESAWGQCLQ